MTPDAAPLGDKQLAAEANGSTSVDSGFPVGPDPGQAAFPYFSPRRLGATAVASCKIWGPDFRERLPKDDANRPTAEEVDARRRKAAAEFDALGKTLIRLTRAVNG
jgi:hypothetical protein